ncbi:hypothetical protein C8Q80DRAFT_1269034 [Daedaleopsis nitida]|nr:hypothetical protein C8Q80DRAFT_1269034 [Daedaleopsis nitida]
MKADPTDDNHVFESGFDDDGQSRSREGRGTKIQEDMISHSEEDQKPPMDLDEVLDHTRQTRKLQKAVESLRNPDVKIKEEILPSDDFLLDHLTWEGINHRHSIPVSAV